MKKYFIAAIVLMAIGLSSFAITVPKVVTEAFAKKFPGATNIKWGKENATEFEAEFKWNGKSVSANFLTNGNWVETEAEIESTDLPRAVAQTIQTKKPGSIIIRAFKIETAKGKTTFEAEIKTGNKKSELIINEDGTMAK